MQISTTGYTGTAPVRVRAPAAIAAAAAYPGLVRKIVRNMIESWPDEVYDQGLVEARRFGRRTFFVCDPALIRTLLVGQAEAIGRDDSMISALAPVLGRGILTSDGPAWRAQRRNASPAFRPDSVTALVPAMQDAIARTAERWEARGTTRIDLLDEMMTTTFDIIGATMLPGEPALGVAAFGRSLTTYLDSVGWKIALSMLGIPAWVPHPGSIRAARAARRMRGSIATIIARRRASGEESGDLLGLMMRAGGSETSGGCPHLAAASEAGMSDEALTDNLLTFIAAGHETTALAMAWTFRLLAEHPQVETRLRAEIACAGSRPSPEAFAPEALAPEALAPEALPYARQVVMEAMRLYPPAPMIVRQAVTDVRLGSTTIPAGSAIHVPIYAIHRHSALWTSPETFDPDRFAPEIERDRYGYLPFGAGPRVCIGMGFALTECVAILAGLLPRFRFETPSGARPEARFKVTLRPHGGMPMRIAPRRRFDA